MGCLLFQKDPHFVCADGCVFDDLALFVLHPDKVKVREAGQVRQGQQAVVSFCRDWVVTQIQRTKGRVCSQGAQLLDAMDAVRAQGKHLQRMQRRQALNGGDAVGGEREVFQTLQRFKSLDGFNLIEGQICKSTAVCWCGKAA